MLEVRKNTYSKNYENTFFREFARHLHKSFSDNGRSGLIIGSPFCEVDERLQIDALLITEKVVCIIDFKNFSGKINLPNENNFEMGIWTNETKEPIKGGSSINPFIQLKNQKRRFSEVFIKYIKSNLTGGDKLDCDHIVNVVCFQKEIELNREIPNSKELAFWIIDRINFIEKISDIIDVSDKDVNISPNSYDAFKKVFRADKFKFDDKPLEDKLKVFADKSATLDFKKLYVDQHSALTEIKTFLENPEQQVFVLQGTANSGKSYLIPFIQELAYNLGIQETEIFASSSRVANNLLTIGGLERVNSIYSYIYGGQKNNKQENEQTKEKKNTEEIDETNDSEELQVEKIPLKNCDNAENALFIVDESQLVSDSFNQSIDLIFGTGYLLKDFLSFTNSINTKRKIIFIGDPFQLQLGKTDESPLNPLYLEEAYKLKTNAYQLLDKPDFSVINKEALFCVDKIRNQYFNSLKFNQNDDFKILSDDIEKENAIAELINTKKGHLLYFRNEDAQERNLKIKKDLLKNGEFIAVGDLVVFNNNIETKNDNPDAFPKKILNGQFATITKTSGDLRTEPVFDRKGKLISTLCFVEVSIKHSESGYESTILSFENFRNSPKAVLSNNDANAFRIFLYQLANKELDNFIQGKYQVDDELSMLLAKLKEGEKVKTKINKKLQSILRTIPSTEYYKIKNCGWLKFGWAMTVHKSMSYKWQEVIFNVEKAGIANENHFRWLYTGISRARKKVFLINYKPISPFDKTEFVNKKGDKKTKDFLFISDSLDIEIAKKELVEIVRHKVTSDFVINQIDIPGYNVRINFSNDSKQATLDFGFNLKCQFKFPKYINGDTDLSNKLVELISNEKENINFDSIPEVWRKTEYLKLNNELSKVGFRFHQIIQTPYKDRIKIVGNNEELDLEIDYNGDGAFSFITAKYFSNQVIWSAFINSVNHIKV
ncbi:MAG: ATP-binding domain-containing protein [Saprospiraceae bacterium]|nr:ATP-binding domain-containing protein [Saprospiraceae bacterium]